MFAFVIQPINMANKKTASDNVRKGIWSIHVAFWIVIISFLAYFAALSFNGMYMFQRSVVLITGNILFFYICYFWIFPEFILKKRIALGLTLIFIIILIVMATRLFGDMYLMEKFNRAPEFALSLRRRILLMFFGETVFAGFAGLVRMTVSIYENNKRMDELENLQLNTELQFLKSQMSPHFLFNSINNIYSLVWMKSDKAPEALMKLSELLRYSLYDCHGKVQLAGEIEAIYSYIDLFKLKFEDDINLTVSNELRNTELPIEPLLFIPLVENAFKYSGLGMSKNAWIKIRLYEENSYCVLQITNTIGNINKEHSASGIGLANIRKRLGAIYPEKYNLNISENEKIFDLTLQIQLI